MSYKNTYLRVNLQEYATIFAMDWSFSTDSEVAFKRRDRNKVRSVRVSSDLWSLRDYFGKFKGKKILVYEETTGAHWLYVNLKSQFDRIVICDPYRNSLLKEGPKTDKLDAFKLLHLLMNNSLKEVYHNDSKIYEVKTFMSAYNDLVKADTRIKNQSAAFKRAYGVKKDEEFLPEGEIEQFAFIQQRDMIEELKKRKALYERKMHQIIREHVLAKNLTGIPGFGLVFSLNTYSTIIEPRRFATRNHLYSYCGLALHKNESGKFIKGKRGGRFNPILKWTFKTAATKAIHGHNDIHDLYIYLLGKGKTEREAHNEIARYICRVSWGMMKNGTKYEPYRWRRYMY